MSKNNSKREESKVEKGNKIISNLLDVKLFGGMIPEEARMIGSIQFEWGRSLHDIDIENITVSSAFSSSEEKVNGSFGSRYVIPYALYGTGVIYSPTRNKSMKEINGNGLSRDDYEKFEEGLKYGVLSGRSGVKGFIEPILIIKVVKNKSVKNRFDSLSDEIIVNKINDKILNNKDLDVDLSTLRRFIESNKKESYERIEVFTSVSGARKYKDLKQINNKYSDLKVLDDDLEKSIEYVIIYEIKYSNPNGDPDMDNMPRRWEGTNIGIISPERQKRWIRDYLEEDGELILISRNGKTKKAKDRLKEIENLLK